MSDWENETGGSSFRPTPASHLESNEVECPTCEAAPNEPCRISFAGREFTVTDHPERQERADLHHISTRNNAGGVMQSICEECGWEDIN